MLRLALPLAFFLSFTASCCFAFEPRLYVRGSEGTKKDAVAEHFLMLPAADQETGLNIHAPKAGSIFQKFKEIDGGTPGGRSLASASVHWIGRGITRGVGS